MVYPEQIKGAQIGFENHWNVFHWKKRGLDPTIAQGLACFLNSTELDNYFRVFSGHTQVNATDLRNMKYPPLATLKRLGEAYKPSLSQEEIDTLVKQQDEPSAECLTQTIESRAPPGARKSAPDPAVRAFRSSRAPACLAKFCQEP